MATTLTADAKEGVDDRPMVFVHIENHAAAAARDRRRRPRAIGTYFRCCRGTCQIVGGPGPRPVCPRPRSPRAAVGRCAGRALHQDGTGETGTLAQANSDARRVYVFWDRIGPAVDHQAVAHGDALGLVIAHELGHVLLPSSGHSRDSIMQANYDVVPVVRLKFDAEESALMRAFIAAAQAALDPETIP